MTQEIWQFCINRNICLSAVYVPRKANVEADEERNQDTEWILNSDIAGHALDLPGVKSEIDLFVLD